MEVGAEEIYTYRYTVTDESHFNVSLIVMNKVTGQCPQTTTFLKRKRAEAVSNRGPFAYQPNALPLGQTGSQPYTSCWSLLYYKRCSPLSSRLPHVSLNE